jgi:hypothetical protein
MQDVYFLLITRLLVSVTVVMRYRVRFHYGHPDIFDRLFHITRGGISKASKTINLNGDIFSGNSAPHTNTLQSPLV